LREEWRGSNWHRLRSEDLGERVIAEEQKGCNPFGKKKGSYTRRGHSKNTGNSVDGSGGGALG